MVRVGDVVVYDDSEWTVEEIWSAHGLDLVTIRDNAEPSWSQDVRADEIRTPEQQQRRRVAQAHNRRAAAYRQANGIPHANR